MQSIRLIILLVVCGAVAPAFATDQKEFSRACQDIIAGKSAHGRKVGELFEGTWYDRNTAVAIMPVSRRELVTLIEKGAVEDDTGFLINPVSHHPVIASWLYENPGLNGNGHDSDDLPRAASLDAAARTIADILEDRTARSGGRITIERDELLAISYSILSGNESARIQYSPDTQTIAALAEAANVHVGEPARLNCMLTKNLARRLNMGPDQSDLRRWNLLRAMAETFSIPWSNDGAGPDLERALASYFSKLPLFAGALLVLNERVVPRIEWDPDDVPRLSRVTLNEVVKIDTVGQLEQDLLNRLACAPKSAE